MKQCPTCSKEFPDTMRFCQTDGTLLVEKVDAAPVDPYKTVVGNQDDIASAIPPLDPFKTMVASPLPKAEDDLLDIPKEPDLLKTMVMPPDDLKAESKAGQKEDSGAPLDLPPVPSAPSAPLIEPKPPVGATPPNAEPKVESPFGAPPNFGDAASSSKPENAPVSDPFAEKNNASPTPPPPFESKPFGNDFSGKSPYGNQDSKPIPSPFDLSMPPGYMPPPISPFDEPKAAPVKDFNEPFAPVKDFAEPSQTPSPFDSPNPFGNADPFAQNQPLQQSEWTPPPAPDANWQNQDLGANTPLQPPPAGQSLNQTLPIVSLVLGIVSLCCYISPVTGIAALITGYLGIKNVNANPNEYGGKTLAIIGMVLGGLFLLVGLLYWVYIIFIIGLAASGGLR